MDSDADGFTGLMLMFAVFTIGALYPGPWVASKFSPRMVIFCGSILYTLQPLAGAWPEGVLLFSFLSGVAASIVWVSQGMYMAKLGHLKLGKMATLGAIFAIVFGLNMILSQVCIMLVRNLATGNDVEAMKKLVAYSLLAVGAVGTVLLLFLPNHPQQVEGLEAPHPPSPRKMIKAALSAPVAYLIPMLFLRGTLASLFGAHFPPMLGLYFNKPQNYEAPLMQISYAIPQFLLPMAWGATLKVKKEKGIRFMTYVALCASAVGYGLYGYWFSVSFAPDATIESHPESTMLQVVVYSGALFFGVFESVLFAFAGFIVAEYADANYIAEAFSVQLVFGNLGNIMISLIGRFGSGSSEGKNCRDCFAGDLGSVRRAHGSANAEAKLYSRTEAKSGVYLCKKSDHVIAFAGSDTRSSGIFGAVNLAVKPLLLLLPYLPATGLSRFLFFLFFIAREIPHCKFANGICVAIGVYIFAGGVVAAGAVLENGRDGRKSEEKRGVEGVLCAAANVLPIVFFFFSALRFWK